MEFKHEVIFCVVNAGFSDAVMDAAKEFGARGGTVIHARGTANSEAEKLYRASGKLKKCRVREGDSYDIGFIGYQKRYSPCALSRSRP